MDLELAKIKAEEFVRNAGALALKAWGSNDVQVKYKTMADFTTQVDQEIENDFSQFVKANFKGHGFKGEEDKALTREGEYIWVIDPIDGTKFFAASVPLWGLTVALKHGEETLIGIIYNPVTDQMYTAIKGEGAFLNEQKINVTPEKNLKKLQIALDIPVDPEFYEERKSRITPVVERLNTNIFRVRNIGSGPYSLAWLSQGFFGAYVDLFRPESKLIDIEGGLLIAQEAGAVVNNRACKKEPDMERTIVASSQEVMDQILPLVEEI